MEGDQRLRKVGRLHYLRDRSTAFSDGKDYPESVRVIQEFEQPGNRCNYFMIDQNMSAFLYELELIQ